MKVFVNQEEKSFNDSLSLLKLLEDMGVKPVGLAIAVNQSVIPKDSWDSFSLKENDDVMLVRATQGG